MTHVGPNPTISGYVRSQGQALKVVAGAASGGAAPIVSSDCGIKKPEDFHGKRVASPQLGNTQDVALHAWLRSHGMKLVDKGGDVQVMPMANPDQLTLLLKKQLDAAWAPEPWATRLMREGSGRLFLDERDLWPNPMLVQEPPADDKIGHNELPELVKNWIRAQVELTDWIHSNLPQAKNLLNAQVQRETGKAIPPVIVDKAFTRIEVTDDPIRNSLLLAARLAYEAGFLGRQMPYLSGVHDLTLLNEILREKGRTVIQ